MNVHLHGSKTHFQPRLYVGNSQLLTDPLHYLYTPSAQGMFVEGKEGRKVILGPNNLEKHTLLAQSCPVKTQRRNILTDEYSASAFGFAKALRPCENDPVCTGDHDGTALHHCIWEVVDNSVDEHLAGHTPNIDIILNLTIRSCP